jgi:hypothetical protein
VSVPRVTPWQEAAQCLRLCLEGARQEVPAEDWPMVAEFLLQLGLAESAKGSRAQS